MAVVHDPVRRPVGGDALRDEGGEDGGLAIFHPPGGAPKAGLGAAAGPASVALSRVVRVVKVVLAVVCLAVAVGAQEGDPAAVGLPACLGCVRIFNTTFTFPMLP